MSYVQVHSVNVTTNAGGVGIGYTPVVTGAVSTVIYKAAAVAPYENTANFSIRTETTNEAVWVESLVAASKTVAPRQATHTTAGVAALYAGSGVAVLDKIKVAHDRVAINVSGAGNTTTGQFFVVIE